MSKPGTKAAKHIFSGKIVWGWVSVAGCFFILGGGGEPCNLLTRGQPNKGMAAEESTDPLFKWCSMPLAIQLPRSLV
jgi:hypothetical protein